MKDPYAVIGLARDADPDLLKSRYKELHDLYAEQRFMAGEEGNEGARKLQELEEAWVIISDNIEKDSKKEEFNGDYGAIDSLIRAGKYNEAQDLLDSISDRRGEWHYMQAIVFYKREWLTESKTQLEMALQDDPDNAKYRSSLDKLNLTMQGQRQAPVQQPAPSSYGGYGNNGEQRPQDQTADMANCLSSCCCAYCLADCLCSSMRCC